jgi:fructokinase
VATTPADCLSICDLNIRRPFVSDAVILDSLNLADVLKVNEEEAAEVARVFAHRPQRPGDVDSFRDQLLPAIVSDRAVFAVTRGVNGCVVGDRTETIALLGLAVAVADTVGAGDAFTAALLTQRLEGKSLREAARFANAYAAVVASKPGGTPLVSRAEVERLL